MTQTRTTAASAAKCGILRAAAGLQPWRLRLPATGAASCCLLGDRERAGGQAQCDVVLCLGLSIPYSVSPWSARLCQRRRLLLVAEDQVQQPLGQQGQQRGRARAHHLKAGQVQRHLRRQERTQSRAPAEPAAHQAARRLLTPDPSTPVEPRRYLVQQHPQVQKQ